MNKRLFTLFLLGFSSGLPLALITSTLQAWFADVGVSVLTTGMLSLVSLPYLYRPLWGPLLDRYSLTSLGRRRSWILFMQLGLLISFNGIAYLTPISSPLLIALIAVVIAALSATQDTAIDAHRVEYVPVAQHGIAASLAVFGYRLALFIAGGLALIIAHHWGWAMMYRLMGLLMLGNFCVTWCSKEPVIKQTANPTSLVTSFIAPLQELTRRPGIVPLISFIILYKLGEAFTTTTSGIVMPFLIQGLGFSLDTIGYINKLLGIGAILLGGLVAGLLLIRWSLYRALLVFGLLQALTNSLFVVLAIVGKNTVLLALAVVCDNFAAGMGSTALVALFMQLVNQQFTATQFSLLVAISTLPRIVSGPIAALLQVWLGWVGLYQMAFLLSLGFVPLLLMIRKQLTDKGDLLPSPLERVVCSI